MHNKNKILSHAIIQPVFSELHGLKGLIALHKSCTHVCIMHWYLFYRLQLQYSRVAKSWIVYFKIVFSSFWTYNLFFVHVCVCPLWLFYIFLAQFLSKLIHFRSLTQYRKPGCKWNNGVSLESISNSNWTECSTIQGVISNWPNT